MGRYNSTKGRCSPEKRDVYVLKHNKRTNTFSGSIKRVLPISQGARTWEINGVINHGYFIASFGMMDRRKVMDVFMQS